MCVRLSAKMSSNVKVSGGWQDKLWLVSPPLPGTSSAVCQAGRALSHENWEKVVALKKKKRKWLLWLLPGPGPLVLMAPYISKYQPGDRLELFNLGPHLSPASVGLKGCEIYI